MFPTNWWIYLLTALIPMIIGSIYYSPKVAGNAWMKTNGFTEESLEGANMAVILGISYVLSIFISMAMAQLCIHQGGVAQLMMPEMLESGSAAQTTFNDLMNTYGHKYRTFGHGALHGFFSTIFFILPIIAINAMFERRGWKYVWIHVGYWAISLSLIGGIVSQFLTWAPMS